MISKLINLTESEFDLPVLRYLSFPKFVSLLTFQAIWFPKLRILQDKYEGTLPFNTKINMHGENQKWKTVFADPNLHRQIDEWPDSNVKDGRELTLVNCWFLGKLESARMWAEYVGTSEGVAIKSTIRQLAHCIYVYPEFSHIGKVKYVDLSTYTMKNSYEACQAHERAFLKQEIYSHEQEIRIATMSLKTPMCVNMDGKPITEQECSGKNMNNFENQGLYIRVDLIKLINSIILAPQAADWFEMLIKRISEVADLKASVQRSEIGI